MLTKYSKSILSLAFFAVSLCVVLPTARAETPNAFTKILQATPDRCVAHCLLRRSDGSCGSWGNDICGPRVNCSPKCLLRRSDGECLSYGDDFCGRNAECSPHCLLRRSDGTCGSYGDDVCTNRFGSENMDNSSQ